MIPVFRAPLRSGAPDASTPVMHDPATRRAAEGVGGNVELFAGVTVASLIVAGFFLSAFLA